MNRPAPGRLALYVAWAVVFASTLTAGVYTMGMFFDVESVGTAEDPNSIEAAEEFVTGEAFGNSGFGNGGNTGNAGNAFLGFPGELESVSEWLSLLLWS